MEFLSTTFSLRGYDLNKFSSTITILSSVFKGFFSDLSYYLSEKIYVDPRLFSCQLRQILDSEIE